MSRPDATTVGSKASSPSSPSSCRCRALSTHTAPAGAPLKQALDGDHDAEDFACMLIASRQSVSPKRLVEPGPDAAQL